jgi:hypothetical protein
VNWRILGCGGLAAGVFVIVAAFAVFRAGSPAECPASLPYEPAPYRPAGDQTTEPRLDGIDEPLERTEGAITFGLASWRVWVEPGRAPRTDEPLPQRIVLECGDGTFQAYQRGTG